MSRARDTAHPAPRAATGSGLRLCLARHAEVDAAWRGKAYGDLDVPLSPEGEQRTQVLGRSLAALGPTALLSSPLERARRLAAVVETALPHGPAAGVDDGLREIHRGSWQGLDVGTLHEDHADDVRAFYADPWTWAGHGGEADRDVLDRAWNALAPTLEQLRAGAAHSNDDAAPTLVVTTHYNVLRVLAAALLDLPPVHSFSLRVDTGRVVLLVDGAQGWELAGSNLLDPASV